jgi:hypothetical protein
MKKKSTVILGMISIFFPLFLHAQYMGAKMTQEIIDQYGTKTFNAPKDSVFNALQNVLVGQGYEIAFAKPEKGEIKTKRKILSGHGNDTRVSFYYKQYIGKVEEKEPGKTTVVLTPKVFSGETDISEKKCWVLKGASGEYKLWETLFNDLKEQLE